VSDFKNVTKKFTICTHPGICTRLGKWRVLISFPALNPCHCEHHHHHHNNNNNDDDDDDDNNNNNIKLIHHSL